MPLTIVGCDLSDYRDGYREDCEPREAKIRNQKRLEQVKSKYGSQFQPALLCSSLISASACSVKGRARQPLRPQKLCLAAAGCASQPLKLFLVEIYITHCYFILLKSSCIAPSA